MSVMRYLEIFIRFIKKDKLDFFGKDRDMSFPRKRESMNGWFDSGFPVKLGMTRGDAGNDKRGCWE